jgi:hypothetical protein
MNNSYKRQSKLQQKKIIIKRTETIMVCLDSFILVELQSTIWIWLLGLEFDILALFKVQILACVKFATWETETASVNHYTISAQHLQQHTDSLPMWIRQYAGFVPRVWLLEWVLFLKIQMEHYVSALIFSSSSQNSVNYESMQVLKNYKFRTLTVTG